MNELMIYVMDFGWSGNIVVIAQNEDDARRIMSGYANYSEDSEMECYPIKEGFSVANYGDL